MTSVYATMRSPPPEFKNAGDPSRKRLDPAPGEGDESDASVVIWSEGGTLSSATDRFAPGNHRRGRGGDMCVPDTRRRHRPSRVRQADNGPPGPRGVRALTPDTAAMWAWVAKAFAEVTKLGVLRRGDFLG